MLYPRLDPFGKAGRLMLHPLAKDGDHTVATSDQADTQNIFHKAREILNLKFYFETPMAEQDVTALGEALNDIMRRTGRPIPISRISWNGLDDVAMKYARRWIEIGREMKDSASPTSVTHSTPNSARNQFFRMFKGSVQEKLRKIDSTDEELEKALIQNPGYLFKVFLYSIWRYLPSMTARYQQRRNWLRLWMIAVSLSLMAILILQYRTLGPAYIQVVSFEKE